jgi:predicted flavoprotein YhiN
MPTDAFDYDAIILGAGAAGLMAAIHAAERGRKVLLLEKGKKAGVKILMSGGTMCGINQGRWREYSKRTPMLKSSGDLVVPS